jgi:hypothetical protein
MKCEDRFRLIVVSVLAIACQQSVRAQRITTAGTKNIKSVRRFVQDFYDWYAPKAATDTPGGAWEMAIKAKSSAFEPKLLQALREDVATQAKAAGELVGLDFDPLLDSQDPEGRYVVGNASRRGRIYLVSIYSVPKGKTPPKAAVVAELEVQNGRWRYINFLYSGNQNLLSILKALKKSRLK